ncbi:MAG: metallophosphoesterase [Balneolaceae bacterium]
MPWSLRIILILAGLSVICMLYTGSRLFWSYKVLFFQNITFFQVVTAATGFLFLIYPLSGFIQYLISGTFSQNNYPKLLIYLFWYGFIFSAVMVSWTLFLDLASAGFRYGLKVNAPELDALLSRMMIGITVLMLVYTGIKTIWHSNKIAVKQVTYPLNTLPQEEIEPLKIVHISDLHADRFTTPSKINGYIDKVNHQKPDIIFFTGDLITAGVHYIEEGAAALGRLDARLGTYAVMGDHDYWAGESLIKEALEKWGVKVLGNESHEIQNGNNRIQVTGVTELYSKKLIPNELENLMENSQNSQNSQNSHLNIVFSHQATARIIELAKKNGYQLVLGGHTHGGQIRIPFFFYPVTLARLETKYVKGKKWFNQLLLNINSGLGYTLAPVRYGAPAQISVIKVE